MDLSELELAKENAFQLVTLVILIDFEGHIPHGDTSLNETRFSKLREFVFPAGARKTRVPMVIVSSHSYDIYHAKILEIEAMVKQETKEGRGHVQWITIDPEYPYKITDIINMVNEQGRSKDQKHKFKIRPNTPQSPIIIGGCNTTGCVAISRGYSALNCAKEGLYTQILLPMCADYQVSGISTADKHMEAFSQLYQMIKYTKLTEYIDIAMEPTMIDFENIEDANWMKENE